MLGLPFLEVFDDCNHKLVVCHFLAVFLGLNWLSLLCVAQLSEEAVDDGQVQLVEEAEAGLGEGLVADMLFPLLLFVVF